MRVKEEIRKHGCFWLPSAPERKLPGTLSIRDGGNVELEVFGIFDRSIEGINRLQHSTLLGRIIGQIEGYSSVTLEDCFYKSCTPIAFGSVPKPSIILANRALLGCLHDEKEEILINTFQFSVEGIDEWLELSGIEVVKHRLKNQMTSINYSPPDEISLNLKDGMRLLITFRPTLAVPKITEAKIAQKGYFKLISEQERPLSDFISSAYKITTFLNFAIDKTTCMDEITVTSDKIYREIGNEKAEPVPISLYHRSLPYSETKPEVKWHEMLFTFTQIQENVESILNKWFDAYSLIDPAFNLYFSAKTGGYKFLEGKFLALAQGIETCHRRTSDEKLMDDTMFDQLDEALNALAEESPEEHKEWISGKLRYGNELSLRQRIKRIIEPFKDLLGESNKERKTLIKKIVDTRNYLTHYDQSLEKEAASGRDLWLLCRKMEGIFQLHLLQVLDFTPEEISSMLDENYELRRKLRRS